jgi:hypothetical protein
MKAATRRISVLLNTTVKIDKVNKEVGISYSYPARCCYSHHNDDVG